MGLCKYCGIEFEDVQYLYCPYCGSILDHFHDEGVQSIIEGIELAGNNVCVAPAGNGELNQTMVCTDGIKTYVNCLFEMGDGNLELCWKRHKCEIYRDREVSHG